MEHYSRWTVYGPVTGTSAVLVNAAVEALAALTPARVTPLVPAQRLVATDDAHRLAA